MYKITGQETDALLDAVAEWDLHVELDYPFRVRGTAQELIMVMISAATDPRMSTATAHLLRDSVITEAVEGADEDGREEMITATFNMVNVIIGNG